MHKDEPSETGWVAYDYHLSEDGYHKPIGSELAHADTLLVLAEALQEVE